MENNTFKSSTDGAYLEEVRRKNALSRQTDPTYQEMYSMFGMGEKKNNSHSTSLSNMSTMPTLSNDSYLQEVRKENAKSRENSSGME